MVYSLVANRAPTTQKYGSLVLGTRGETHLTYNLLRPRSKPLAAVRDAPRQYGAPKRPIGAEAILHAAWRHAGLGRAEVRGRDGHTYKIIYGGKPGGSFGPDFTDAVVERDDGVVFRGDIEIHVRESDWHAHGHHKNPRYNGVVLHVVAAESEGRPAVKATGAAIPLLALNWKPAKPGLNSGHQHDGPAGPGPGSASARSGSPEFSNAPLGPLDLAAAGIERFHAQAAGIAIDIESFGADQAVWLGIMGALGYPRNRRAFRMLAARVTWSAAVKTPGPRALGALLMRAAGLDAGSRTEAVPVPAAKMGGPKPEWVRPWGRPANSPVARISAISALVPLWGAGGGIAHACTHCVGGASGPVDLSAMFRPAELLDDPATTVLGQARAAEIVVNVLLPAAFALATRTHGSTPDSVGLKNWAVTLYNAHPRLQENSLTREAKVALGVDFTVPKVSSARDQQGLVALYREMFRRGVRPRQARLPGV